MKAENLTQIVSELSPEEQAAVKEFIAYLRERSGRQRGSADGSAVSFQSALDEFISAHPDLLRRLAQ